MKNKLIYIFTMLFMFFLGFSQTDKQENNNIPQVKVTGKVVEKTNKKPLEYATITLKNIQNSKTITGGITNGKGEYLLNVVPGTYDVILEFMSFKTVSLKGKSIQNNLDLGTIALEENLSELKEVVVTGKRPAVEIKLDKKVYNVGDNNTTKGGTATDVLETVPSVTVDSDGTVSLRGNDNVRILIDGKPANALNITDALKTIPSDALDKIEVITNPSSRYDSEGSGGIINIVLKKGKNQGINGTFTGVAGVPENFGLSGNLNYKAKNYNLFTTLGYNDMYTPGRGQSNYNYTYPNNASKNYIIDQPGESKRQRKGYNLTLGGDWFLSKTFTWTNSINYRNNNGNEPNNITQNYKFPNHPTDNYSNSREIKQYAKTSDFQLATNVTKKFKKDGHQLTFDATYSENTDNDNAIVNVEDAKGIAQYNKSQQSSFNKQKQVRRYLQTDYVLPLSKDSKFEAGYKGNFLNLDDDFNVSDVNENGSKTPITYLTNHLQYTEKTNALYTQFGSKYKKISYMFGIQYVNSSIYVDLIGTQKNHIPKNYQDWLPTAFLTYELSENQSFSLSYSKRIARPRDRFLVPVANYANNISIFQGNPNLDPSYTNTLELAYLTKFKKVTLTSSVYYNYTKNPFIFASYFNGSTIPSPIMGQDPTNVTISSPFNLDNQKRFGVEFNANYTPYKWWKLNGSINLFRVETNGNFYYDFYKFDENGNLLSIIKQNQNYNNNSKSGFAKLSSKLTLPNKIDWQINLNYTAPQGNAQGKSLSVTSLNTGFSKDLFKDKATLAFNVIDVFNSNKFKREVNLENTSNPDNVFNAHNNIWYQRRVRQFNLSFTYRFNKKKTDREKPTKLENGDDNGNTGF